MSRHQFGHPDQTEYEIGHTTHRVAEVHPMDLDGVVTMTVGTIVWAVATVALIPFWGTLQENGRQWWLWSALAGFGLGLIGIEYCRRRRAWLRAERVRAGAPAAEAPDAAHHHAAEPGGAQPGTGRRRR